MSGLTYDAGALLEANAHRRDLWALHLRNLQRGQRPVVPSGALGQAWRGGPQAQLSRLWRGCRIEDLDEDRARGAGTACDLARTKDVIDASVVTSALARDDIVVTSDPDDLVHTADALGRPLRVHRI